MGRRTNRLGQFSVDRLLKRSLQQVTKPVNTIQFRLSQLCKEPNQQLADIPGWDLHCWQ